MSDDIAAAANRVIIVIPQHRFPLTRSERYSLGLINRVLGGHPRVVATGAGMDAGEAGLPVEVFDDEYFSTHWGYNRLLLGREFYERFRGHEYMLVCQLDCLVFRDELLAWCDRGFDYIGAPWFYNFRDDVSHGFMGVGNGGFSLRNIESSLRVLRLPGWRVLRDPLEAWRVRYSRKSRWGKALVLPALAAMCVGYRNNLKWRLTESGEYEDLFWGLEASRFDRRFRVADVRTALGFSFEYAPRYCLEQNGGKLPFGCHAWEKTDPVFWRGVLKELGLDSGLE